MKQNIALFRINLCVSGLFWFVFLIEWGKVLGQWWCSSGKMGGFVKIKYKIVSCAKGCFFYTNLFCFEHIANYWCSNNPPISRVCSKKLQLNHSNSTHQASGVTSTHGFSLKNIVPTTGQMTRIVHLSRFHCNTFTALIVYFYSSITIWKSL